MKKKIFFENSIPCRIQFRRGSLKWKKCLGSLKKPVFPGFLTLTQMQQKAPFFPYKKYGKYCAFCCIWVRVRKPRKTGFFRDPWHFFHFKDPLRNWILHGNEFSKKFFFFIFTKLERCEFYPNFKRPITRLRSERPGCRRFWVKAQLKGFPMSPDFGRQTVQQGPVFWLEERSHFRIFGPEIQNFEKISNFFFQILETPTGAFQMMQKIWVSMHFLGK